MSHESRDDDSWQGFVLNQREVLRTVPFSQFTVRSETTGELNFFYGLHLPKNVEEAHTVGKGSKKHTITRTVQRWVPIVVSSLHIKHDIFNGELPAWNVRFNAVARKREAALSLVTPKQWTAKIRRAPSIHDLLEQYIKQYKRFLYFADDRMYVVRAAWDLGTWFYKLFPQYPYIELRGVKEAAKSKNMRLSRLMTFNPSRILSAPSTATLFRIVDAEAGTLYLDECEKLYRKRGSEVEEDERVEILNAGYEEGATVPRVIDPKTGEIHYFNAYCPKMLASINGLRGAAASRAILHVMTRAPDNDERGDLEPDPEDESFTKIRDASFFAGLEHFRAVKITADAIESTGLKRRMLQLFRPLLAIAKLASEEHYNTVLAVARAAQTTARNDEYDEGSWVFKCCEEALKRVRDGQRRVFLFEMIDAIQVGSDENRPKPKSVSTVIDKVGFAHWKVKTSSGVAYDITLSALETLVGTLIPSLLSNDYSSLSSYSSQDRELQCLTPQDEPIGVTNSDECDEPK